MTKKYSYWLSSGKYSLMQKAAVVFFGVLTFMVLARAFEPKVYGVWGLFMIISSIIETSRSAFIRNGYVLFINMKEKEDHPRVEYAALMTNTLFTVIVMLIFLLGGGFLARLLNAPELSTILYYYVLTLIVLIFFSQREIFMLARMDFKGIFWMYCLRNGLFMSIAAATYFFHLPLTLTELAIFYGICALVGVGFGTLYCRKYERVHFKKNKTIFVEFINYGKFVYGNNLFSLIFRSTDSFMTASFISTAASAYYNSCNRIANFVDMPSQALGDVMFPRAARIMKTGNMEEIKTIYEKTVAATLTFTIPMLIIVLLFPREILLVIAGKQYLGAAGILRIIAFYGFFLPFIKQFGNIMDATERPHINFRVMMTFAIVNIGLNYLYIHYFGLPGGAYGTFTSYLLLLITTQIILGRLLKISIVGVVKNIFILYPDYIQIARSTFKKVFGISYEK